MRVLRVLTRPNVGGPTRQAAALYREHRRLGVQTLLAVGRCGAGETALTAAELGVPTLALAEAMQRGEAAEGLVEIQDLGRGIAPFADRRAAAALVALMQRCRPDVVHTHTSKAGLLGRRAAFAVGVRVVAHTFHGHVLRDYYGPLRSWALAQLERRLAARTDLLFAVSPSCAAELAELGVAPRARLAVLPPAVDVELAAAGARGVARAALGLPGDALALACAGRLVPIKRVDAFVHLVNALPEVHGDVFGDGPCGARLRAAAGPRVRFRGARSDLRALLPAYDALVIPSRREGCPLVAVEAFAAGVPVVGFDVPGVRDVLGDWGAGVLVADAALPVHRWPPWRRRDPDRESRLLGAVQELLAAPGRRAELAQRARAAVARFAPAAVALALRDQYAAAMASPARG
jgi:glycosyltransferase involved in cell wall biosynthesis